MRTTTATSATGALALLATTFVGLGPVPGAQAAGAAGTSVQRSVTLAPSHKRVGVGARVDWHGRVAHTPKGSRVLIQRLVDGRWKRVATTRTRSARGAFRAHSGVGAPGARAFRAYAPAARSGGRSLRPARSAKVRLSVSRWTSVSRSDGGWVGCGTRADHTMWCWGRYVGNGTYGKVHLSPLRVKGRWSQVSAGPFHACALKTNGTAWCWGEGGPALGIGATGGPVRKSPQRVAGGGTWRSIVAGTSHTCGIRSDGTAWCWGYYQDSSEKAPYNQLGNGVQPGWAATRPVRVSGGGTWRSLVATGSRTCGIRADRTAWCWGDNKLGDASNAEDYRGSLGTGTTESAVVPTAVAGGGTWLRLAAGREHTCGIRTNHTLWCWGNNGQAQLGDGTRVARRLKPTKVAGGGSWASVALVDATSCALRTDRSAWCWGSNTFGQLGDGTGAETASSDRGLRLQRRPLEIGHPQRWRMLSGAGLGIRSNGSIWRWGAIDTRVEVGDNHWSGSYYVQTVPMPSRW